MTFIRLNRSFAVFLTRHNISSRDFEAFFFLISCYFKQQSILILYFFLCEDMHFTRLSRTKTIKEKFNGDFKNIMLGFSR